LVLLLVAAASQAAAQSTERVIVQFRDDATFDAFVADYADDERTTASGRSSYHRRDVVGAAMALERRHGFRATRFYSRALKGFAAGVTPDQRRAIEANPLVQRVERDVVIALDPDPASEQIAPWGIPKIGADVSTARSGDGSGDITGPTIYIVDTGIDQSHPDLNVVGHISFIGEPNADCHGHGTGVAGIAAARDNSMYSVGVAPGAPVFGVKVLDCNGLTFTSVIIQALDWIVANGTKPAVVNLSLGANLPVLPLNWAVWNTAAQGFVVTVAAGNGDASGNGIDACWTSPAGAGFFFGFPNGVVTAAATDINDQEATFSNFGWCVDLWAPGVSLTSTWLMSEGGMITASGTSFSAPYAAGAAALLLSRFPWFSPPIVEFVLQFFADLPGTPSKGGTGIRRLSVRYF
jgi:subtilisin family serine protease